MTVYEQPADEGEVGAQPAAEREQVLDAAAAEEPALAPPSPIVDGTWVNPNVPGYAPRAVPRDRRLSYTVPEGRPSFMRIIFGSFVVLTEEITERVAVQADGDEARRAVEAVLRQAANQEQALDRRPFANLRYVGIGLLSGALDGAQDGAGRLLALSNRAAHAAGRLAGPIWNSFLFAPLHQPLGRAELAGESKVAEWIRRGRVEEVRSRALAEVSINNLVEESVSDLTANPQVQVLVQEIIASQSTSMAAEIIEEFRERLVSLDILLMGRLNRDLAAAPDFRQAYAQELRRRRPHMQYRDFAHSLAGSYAGPISRLAGFIVDTIILLLVIGLTSSFVSNTLDLFGLTEPLNNFLRAQPILGSLVVVFVAMFNFLVLGIYFVASWNLTGVTVGDALVGVRVVDRNGQHLSLWRAVLRMIGFYLSLLLLFLGFIWALFDRRRQGWHDKLAGSFVLYDWPAKPDERFLHEQTLAQLQPDQ